MTSNVKGKIVVPVWVDDGVVKAVINDDGEIEVTQETPGDMKVGIHAYISGAWQKQPPIFGYSGRWRQTVTNANADAGTNDLLTTAVPEGYVYVLNAADCYNANTICNRAISAYDGGTLTHIISEVTVAVGVSTVTRYCSIVLAEGDQIRARFVNCAAGDYIQLRCWGYMMRIDL